jgi:DNA-binding transcriptional LysR family regulator
VIDRVARRYPRITFNVIAIQTETLYRELFERNVDFLIARKFASITDEQLGFEVLYQDPYVVAAGLQHPLIRRRKIDLAELVKESWALPPPDSLVGAFVASAFSASGLKFPRATVVTFPFAVRTTLVAAGHFLTVLPRSLLTFPAKHPFIKALPVELPLVSGPIGIFTLSKRTLSPAAHLFIDSARGLAKPSSITN